MARTTTASALASKLSFRPSPDDPRPIYLQLSAALSEAVRAGRLAIGARLPSERHYAQQIGVSRTTVTAAYQELKDAGLIRGYVGRGVVVVADDPDRAATDGVPWPQLSSRIIRPAQVTNVALAPDVISFGNGWLHPSLTPRAALAASAARASEVPDVLTKAAPILGAPALREALVEFFRAKGLKTSPDEVLVTGGAQQGLNVIARTLIASGDTVVCETPTWYGAFRAFQMAGAKVVSVSTDHEGIDPDALEDTVARLRPKLVYLIPTFQCPTGRLLGVARRRRVLECCARFRTPIIESHVYGDLSFGETPPSLKSLDEAGIVIHQGSTSKTISAALRLGWLVAPASAMELLAPAKASLDLSTPSLTQSVLADFLKKGAYARHLPKFRAELRARRDALIAALAEHCPELRVAAPQGGLYLWAQMQHRVPALAVEAAAAAEGVSVRAGDAFLPDGGASSHIRLCYAAPAFEEIAPGAKRLGKALRAVLQRYKDPGSRTLAVALV